MALTFKVKSPISSILLKALEALDFYSIRLLYLYPDEISHELIKTIGDSRCIAHYFDIPVQAGSDHMLKAMRRHGDKAQMMELFATIKKEVPDAVLRTTLIAGFPGEKRKRPCRDLEVP
jgi:ribosomal protein S12 methylthiotransferase